jgi:hypothetical protein
MVPVRAVVLALASTLKLTVPVPDPLAPVVTVIHVAESVAVHAQPAPAFTLNEPVAPDAGTDWPGAESV